MLVQHVATYARECVRLFRKAPQQFRPAELLRFFEPWRRSLEADRSPLTDERPWLTFSAVEYLTKTLRRDMRVFEYGSGGSTLFFARRVRELITIEHNMGWGQRVEAALRQSGLSNWQLLIMPPDPQRPPTRPDPADIDGYGTADPALRDCSFRNYVSAIDEFPDNSFDLICIDGRARPSCLRHAAPKVKPGGCIVLDNTERHYYAPAVQRFGGYFRRLERHGPAPYVQNFAQTSLLFRNGTFAGTGAR